MNRVTGANLILPGTHASALNCQRPPTCESYRLAPLIVRAVMSKEGPRKREEGVERGTGNNGGRRTRPQVKLGVPNTEAQPEYRGDPAFSDEPYSFFMLYLREILCAEMEIGGISHALRPTRSYCKADTVARSRPHP